MGRPCSCCQHPRRAELDAEIVAGTSFRNVAERFSVSIAGVSRHRAHIKAVLAAAGAARRDGQLADAAELLRELHDSKDKVLDAMAEIERLANGQRLAALPALLAAIRVHVQIGSVLLEVEERRGASPNAPGAITLLPGDLEPETWCQSTALRLFPPNGEPPYRISPALQKTIDAVLSAGKRLPGDPGAEASILDSPEWLDLRRSVLDALRPFPKARAAVVQAIRRPRASRAPTASPGPVHTSAKDVRSRRGPTETTPG